MLNYTRAYYIFLPTRPWLIIAWGESLACFLSTSYEPAYRLERIACFLSCWRIVRYSATRGNVQKTNKSFVLGYVVRYWPTLSVPWWFLCKCKVFPKDRIRTLVAWELLRTLRSFHVWRELKTFKRYRILRKVFSFSRCIFIHLSLLFKNL